MKSLVFKSVIQTTQKKESEVSNLWLSGHCSSSITELQVTPDNSNLLGKFKKKFEEISGGKEISKWMVGAGEGGWGNAIKQQSIQWCHRQPKLTSRERIRLIISGVRAGTWLFNESGIGLHGGREFIKDLYGNPRYRFRKINTRRNSQ